MSQQSRPLGDQLQEILAKYRNLNLKDPKACDEFTKAIVSSGLPSYHKEMLTIGLLTEHDGTTTLALHMLKNQEQLRHAEALHNIERRVLEERIAKRQS
jgi:hypothetical protein